MACAVMRRYADAPMCSHAYMETVAPLIRVYCASSVWARDALHALRTEAELKARQAARVKKKTDEAEAKG